MKQIFKPLNGCIILASEHHHKKRQGDRIGKVIEVVGNIVFYKDIDGDIDRIIWHENKTIILGV